jgi:hypothetical protein
LIFIILIFGEGFKLCICSTCNFFYSPVTSSSFGPNILLSILHSNTKHPRFLYSTPIIITTTTFNCSSSQLVKLPFLSHSLLRRFCQIYRELDHPVFTPLDFATVIFLQSNVVSLASNPQPGRSCLCTYVPQLQGCPVIPPGTGFPFRRLLRLAGLRWRYSNPPPHGVLPAVTAITNYDNDYSIQFFVYLRGELNSQWPFTVSVRI